MGNSVTYNITLGKAVQKWGTAYTKSLDFLGETGAMTSLAKGYRYYINQYVPKVSGNLRRTARALGNAHGFGGKGSAWVSWVPNSKVKYVHYQYIGNVYGPNRAVFNGQGPNESGAAGTHSGWRSPAGKGEKYDTGRKMGIPGTYTLHDGRKVYIRGYTTPNTGWGWIKRFADDRGDFGETAVNIRAGRYMYELFCKKSQRTLYKQNPIGGYHIYNSWRQIEKIRD